MRSLSSVGLGLSIVFGCLLLALVGELYYLLWRKRRIPNKEIGDKYFFYMFCWKRPSSLRHTTQELCSSVGINDTFIVHSAQQESNGEEQLETNRTSNDLLLKTFGDDDDQLHDPMEAEIVRLHELSGPPRFLSTIVEETKEDLESEDARSRGDTNKKSLSDLLLSVETPFLTPLASPSFFTPPLTPMEHRRSQHGFNYLSEVSTDAEFNRIKSSPPPKFKFLQDAEEKLFRKRLMEEAEKKINGACSKSIKDEEDGTFITVVVDKNREKDVTNQKHHHQYYSSSTSQVIPLDSSPFQRSTQQQPREVPSSIRAP